MRRRLVLIVTPMLVFGLLGRAEARVSIDEGRQIAMETVRRAGGTGNSVTLAHDAKWATIYEVDGRWWVGVIWETGHVQTVRDRQFSWEDHQHPDAPPDYTGDDARREGKKIHERLFPDFDTSSFQPRDVRYVGNIAKAVWRYVIAENGFPARGICSVEYCWHDREFHTAAAYVDPIPDAWRRPATITEEQAVEIGRKAVTFREGLPVVYVAEKAFEGDGDNLPAQPVWQVMAYDGVPEDQAMRVVFGGCLVDPWTGEVLAIPDYEAAGGAPPEAVAPTNGVGKQPDSPLRTVIAYVMLALGLVGAVVLLRSRRVGG